MTAKPPTRRRKTEDAEETQCGLAALSQISFGHDAGQILDVAAGMVATLSPCRVEATYIGVDGGFDPWPPSAPRHPAFDEVLAKLTAADGPVDVAGRGWGWALGLRQQNILHGFFILNAEGAPTQAHFLLLTLLAQHNAAALAEATWHGRDGEWTQRLNDANRKRAIAENRLETQSRAHEILGAALATGGGEQAIADALHELTALPIAVEDPFGNLRTWSGPGRPPDYPKTDPARRQRQLRALAAAEGPMRLGDNVIVVVQPRADVLGVLAVVDPHQHVTDDELYALRYAGTMLGFELSHQRSVAEIELNLRRELVDDLVAATDDESAYARSEARGS